MSVTVNGTNGLTFADGTTQATGFAPGMRNRIINGDMRIDQRNAGNTVSLSNTTAYTIDRFAVRTGTGSGNSAVRSSTAPAGFSNSLLITIGTGATPSSGTNSNYIYQGIEGVNCADLNWGTSNAKSVTISFWVRSSITGTFGAVVRNDAGNRSYPFTYTISASNTFEYKTITIAGDTSGTWLTDSSGSGIQLMFDLGNGSTYQGTAGSWASADYRGATGGNALVATSGATLYITGLQLESGTKATPFEYRQYGQELALCQRYYWNLNPTPYGNALAMAVAYSTTEADAVVQTPVTMRTTPSLIQAASTNGYTYYFAAVTKTVNSITGITVAGMGISFYLTTTGLTAGQGGLFVVGNSTGSLALSAEL